MKQEKEVWLRGELVEGIASLLQPVAHALLEAGEEITRIMAPMPDALLWERPAGCASPAFHLLHITGVLDRLLTYAEGKSLSEKQLSYLGNEILFNQKTGKELVALCQEQIAITLERLKQFTAESLTDKRDVGRVQLPSTVIGLCTHAAEHTMRHTGQLLVTVRVLMHKEMPA